MRRSILVLTSLMVLVILFASQALAEDKEEARQLFESGLKLMKSDDFAAAAANFERSSALYPTQNSLFNLANCYKAMQRYADALDVLKRLRQEFGDKLKPDIKEASAQQEAEIQSIVATLVLTVEPPSAKVAVDGRELPARSVTGTYLLAPGDHTIEASLAGYRTLRRSVRLVSGAQKSESMVLELGPGYLVVHSDPSGAAVWVDGVEKAKTPIDEALALPPGSHVVALRMAGRKEVGRSVEIHAGERQVLDVALVPFDAAKPATVSSAEKTAQPVIDVTSSPGETAKANPRTRLWSVVAWTSAAGAVASGAAALVFWKVLGDGRIDDAKKDDAKYASTGDLNARNDSHTAFADAQRDGHIAIGLGIGAGVLAVTALGAFWAQASSPGAPTAQSRVSVSPVGLNVRF
jgi:tetratricopeptide (TPR) repeat protein